MRKEPQGHLFGKYLIQIYWTHFLALGFLRAIHVLTGTENLQEENTALEGPGLSPLQQEDGVLLSQGCETGRLKTTEICSLSVQEARSSKSRCWQGHAPSEDSRGRTLAHVFLASDGCQQPLAFLGLETNHSNLCLHCHMVFSLRVSVISHAFYEEPSHGI